MKKTILIFLALFLNFSINLKGEKDVEISESFECTWKSWFKYPKNNSSIEENKAVYVRVDPSRYQDIAFMELYINGKFIRRENSYPFEWCKPSGFGDNYLRRLKKGTYKLKCRIKDKCGKYHELNCTIFIKGRSTNRQTGRQNCSYTAGIKYPQNGKAFAFGSDVYVLLNVQDQQNILYTELFMNGKFIRRETSYPYEWAKGTGSNDASLRNLKAGTYRLKSRVYDKCGKYKDFYSTFYVKGGSPAGDYKKICKHKVDFKYPPNGYIYGYGKQVYVKIEAENHKDIEEVQLYMNNKFIRTERTYPYEWGKNPNDNIDTELSMPKPGVYYLKCKVKTKCGDWHQHSIRIRVVGSTND